MEQPKKEPSNTLIYVSNLPFETTDEQFRDLFKGFTVKTAYVAKRKNGRSKGFGFVNLEKESDQKAAIEKVNGLEFEKRKLIAKVAMNDDRRNEKGELREEFKTVTTTNTQQPPSETVVYVSNLAWTVTDEELRKIFAEFNPKTVTVATRNNGRSKGFGFVEFNNKEDREKALSLDQKTFSERQISVKQSTGFRENRERSDNNNRDNNRRNNRDNNRRSKSPRRNNRDNNRRSKSPRRNDRDNNRDNNTRRNDNRRDNNNRTTVRRSEFSLYVKNLPFELDNEDLKDVFKDFHPTSAHIATRNGRSSGYGFVEFGNVKDRDDAQRNLDQSEINDRLVSVTVSSPNRDNNNRDNYRDNNRDNNRRSKSPRRNDRDNNRDNRPRRTDRSPRRNRENNSNRQPSLTSVYVSNLEFSIDDKALEQVFSGLKIVKAYVARTQSGRSKGFGFVEFKTAEDQKTSLKKDGSEVKGRPIKVQSSFVRDEKTN